MNILLTGGLGFIGSHIAIELLKNTNYNVIIVDNLSNSNIVVLENIKKLTLKNIIFYQLDLMNKNSINTIFAENLIHCVIHLAGLKSVKESVSNPLSYYSQNLTITLNLIEVMEKYECFNMIFSSSSTVYGNQKTPFTENLETGIKMTNPYGKTKYFIEEILKDMFRSNNKWNIIMLRYFNPIGSHESGLLTENPNNIPNNLFPFILKVFRGELDILQIYGNDYNTPDGTCLRDFIHVVDLAIGHTKALEYVLTKKLDNVEAFNLGTGHAHSVNEVVDAFEKINKTTIKKRYDSRRDGDVAESYCKCDKANKILKWYPIYKLDDMVKIKKN